MPTELRNAHYFVEAPVPPASNPAPVVGVLLQPTYGNLAPFGSQLLQANMVKFLESGGSRVVPIPLDAPEDVLDGLLRSVNGVAFMGGATNIIVEPDSPYFAQATRIFNYTLQANDAGDYFPLLGICLGHQLLLLMAGHDQHLMDNITFDSEDLSLPLDFAADAADARFVHAIPEQLRQPLQFEPLTDNQHHNGVTPDAFSRNRHLPSFFRVISTNLDRKGQPFVSTVEAFNYPIWGVQWHPERPLFEWSDEVNRSLEAIQVGQFVSSFFIEETKRSPHRFPSQSAELAALVYQDPITYTYALTNGSYAQMYFYPPYHQMQRFQ
ncbi:hypothetical protein CAOG_008619 [Capsaspora owczarzaki ATCC 30864]|uniref:folate gamma-glutamyl hydrolase n=1 Tax=Capsaspora owczarzaki (strain ATCC 30864) TaxID=595528 RepID=A0A0D2VML9_CAPO3|nr:hypothetical protein CAOG_008619 [Capsaspora owczarzaki ATCC 30864]